MFRKKKRDSLEGIVPNCIEGIKKIYQEKIRPAEEFYLFPSFGIPLLVASDIEAKPSVLFLGQYSTGKTSFIRYLLGGDYPGMNIGPEPTTDRFVAVMHNSDSLIIPGNALVARKDMPFTALSKYGNDFLNKFQASLIDNPLLDELTFIDTPGVLSGEKQRIGRSYNFIEVVEWFANKADMIILCFDAHKLDISDEFKRTIEILKGNEDKVRVILNKSDCVSQQELMRVYGALMWSLGKVMKTPEVMRVYISSFWDNPYKNNDLAELFDAEREDLIHDLYGIPRTATIRKINEIVKRVRSLRVHACILAEINDMMPFFGKEKKKNEIIENLNKVFNSVMHKYNLSPGDFPNIRRYQEKLAEADFSKFPKLNTKLLNSINDCIANDIPKLLKMFPMEQVAAAESNPFKCMNNFEKASEIVELTEDKKAAYIATFQSLEKMSNGRVSGAKCRDIFMESHLSKAVLSKIWSMVDRGQHGALSQDEFVIAMCLVDLALSGSELPSSIPAI